MTIADGALLGTGNVAEVRAQGEDVLKLYRPGEPKSSAFREAAVLAQLEPFGLPVPRVLSVGEHDGRWGLVMTRAPGRTFAEAMLADAEAAPRHLEAMVALHRRIHACAVPGLASLKARLAANIAAAEGLAEPLRDRLLARLDPLPDGDRLCHGDFHPFNLLGTPEAATVIDWLDATRGAPAADLCRSYVLLRNHDEGFAHHYVERYCAASGLAEAEVFAWLPVTAAARLREHVPAEREALLAMAAGD